MLFWNAEPGSRDSCIKLFVVIGFQGEPASENFLGVPEFNALYKLALTDTYTLEEEFFDVIFAKVGFLDNPWLFI